MDESGTPEQRMKSIEYLASIDVSKEKNQRSLKSIDIGTRTKSFFLQCDVPEETKMKFRQACLSFNVTAVTLLQKNLPFTAPVIRDVQFLHPEKRKDSASLTAVSLWRQRTAQGVSYTTNTKARNICDPVRS